MGAVSLGGAVTDGFLARSALADEVDGVILDAPLSSLRDVIDEGAESRTIPGVGWPIPESLEDAGMLIASLRFGVDYDAVDYTDMAGLFDVPLLTFQSSEDQTVPKAVNDRFMTEGSGKGGQYIVVPDVGHVLSWNADPQAYEQAITDFVATTRVGQGSSGGLSRYSPGILASRSGCAGPGGAVTLVRAPAGHRRQRLEDTRLPGSAVMSASSYGGETSTTSMPRRAVVADPPHGIQELAELGHRAQGPRYRGRVPVAHIDIDGEDTPSHSSRAIVKASERHSSRPRATISVISSCACAARPSSPGRPAPVAAQATCRNGTRALRRLDRRRIGSPGRSGTRTRCRRCRRGRRSGCSTPGPGGRPPGHAVTSGQVTGGPRRGSVDPPAAATVVTAASRSAHERAASPEYISTSPASTTPRSVNPSTRIASEGREPSWGR